MRRWLVWTRRCASAFVLLTVPSVAAAGVEVLDESFPDGVRVRCEVETRADGSRFLNGFYRQWDAAGQDVCIGEYRNGERHGKWQLRIEGGGFESGAYANGFRSGPWQPPASRPSRQKRVVDSFAVATRFDQAGNKSAEGCLLDGAPHDVWIFYREDGSRLLEGTYRCGLPEGVWLAYHADGRLDPRLISGVYRKGRRVADVPPWEPRVRFAPALAPRPVSFLPAPADVALEAAVAAALAKSQSGRSSHEAAVLAETPAAVPYVLNAMLALDLATEEGRGKADAAEELLLKPIFAGNELPCGGIERGMSEEAVRLGLLRWRMLWEVVRNQPVRLLLDIPLGKTTLTSPGGSVLAQIGPPATPPPGGFFSPSFGRQGKALDHALERGLDWFARHQEGDGRLDCAGFPSRCSPNQCDGEGSIYDVGVTALALLAFMGDFNVERHARHRERVIRALAWLVKSQDPTTGVFASTSENYALADGTIVHAVSGRGNMETALAVMALSEAAVLCDSTVCRAAAERGERFLEMARNPYKAWGEDYPPAGNNNMSATGFCIIALVEAREAGVPVDPAALEGARLFLDEMTDANTWRTGWGGKGGPSARQAGMHERWPETKTEAMTALAMHCRVLLGEDVEKSAALRGGADLLRKQLPLWDDQEGTIDYIYWMFGTRAMWHMGGADWDKWYERMLDAVIKTQRQDGCEKGSWDPQFDPWGHEGGRVYATAMMLLALEAPFRFARPGS